jgi:hypothetical protein
MRHTSAFISSLLMLCSIVSAQEQPKAKDSIKPKTERYGVRVGADLYKIGRSIFDDKYKGFEVVGDYRLTRKLYLAAEIGNENKTTNEDRFDFVTKGSYFKVGFDYNAYENWLDMENMVYVGLRYGVSSFSQELESYKIYNPNPYFGEMPEIVSGEKFDGLTASWIEIVVGVKAELLNNLYAGFSLRLNYLVSNKEPDNFENLYIPGFNRTYGGKIGVGFNYTVSYFIPIYKATVKAKEKKEKKEKKASK